MLNSFFVQLGILVLYLSFAECIILFNEIPNQMSIPGIYYDFITTVDRCKQECVNSVTFCAAMDFFDGKCFMHEKGDFENRKVVKRTGATQYIAKPCKYR